MRQNQMYFSQELIKNKNSLLLKRYQCKALNIILDNNMIMCQMLLQNLQLFRDRMRLGSIRIDKDQYPYYTFLMGDIDEVFQFFELLYILAQQKLISSLIMRQLLTVLYNFPHEIKKLIKLLDNLRQPDSSINIIEQIESLFIDKHPNKLQRHELSQQNGTIILENDIYERSYTDQIQIDSSRERDRKRMQQQDWAMARKLDQQYMNNMNDDDTPCEICYCNLYDQAYSYLDQCCHVFHTACLSQSFRMAILSNNFPLRCANDQCKRQITDGDVKGVLNVELYDKYQTHTLKSYAELNGDSISWCPTANCGYMFFYEKGYNERFICEQCKKQYCFNCRVEWHKDMTCKQYKISSTVSEDDYKFINFVTGRKFKQCPRCTVWVEKSQGCDHMTCKCKFQFCYKCGGVYSKCECVEKALQEMVRRRQMQQTRKKNAQERKAQKKRQMEQKRINKKEISARSKKR